MTIDWTMVSATPDSRSRYEGVLHTIVQSPGYRLFGLIKARLMVLRTERALMESRLGKWLPLFFAVMAAIDGWLALGSLTQSTIMAAAVFKRLRGRMRSARPTSARPASVNVR